MEVRNRILELADESRRQLINSLRYLTNNFVALHRQRTIAMRTYLAERCRPRGTVSVSRIFKV